MGGAQDGCKTNTGHLFMDALGIYKKELERFFLINAC